MPHDLALFRVPSDEVEAFSVRSPIEREEEPPLIRASDDFRVAGLGVNGIQGPPLSLLVRTNAMKPAAIGRPAEIMEIQTPDILCRQFSCFILSEIVKEQPLLRAAGQGFAVGGPIGGGGEHPLFSDCLF